MSRQFYPEDKPASCRYCYYWKNRKAGCILGKEKCIYEGTVPGEKPSACAGCPYGRVKSCIGWCTRKVMIELGIG